MRFGIRIPPCGSLSEVARAARTAEAGGFDVVWTLDSPLLAGRLLDPYLALAACAPATSRVGLGIAVTNPVSRHPVVTACAALSLDELTGGRVLLGIGSGDSAMRTLGLAGADGRRAHAARRQAVREVVHLLRALTDGHAVRVGGRDLRLPGPWRPIRVYVAATGPRMLELAGEIADGVMIQVGIHPPCVEWALGMIRRGAKAAGRDFAQIEIVSSTMAAIGDDRRLALDRARPLTAWFYAVAPGLLAMAGIAAERRTPLQAVYPDISHPVDHDQAMAEAKRYVADEAVEKFCLVGPPEACVARIRELARLGVHQVYLRHYLTYRVPHELIEIASRAILPAFGSPGRSGADGPGKPGAVSEKPLDKPRAATG
jgi:5,10-methylenetetrahydromethanopterin reductase